MENNNDKAKKILFGRTDIGDGLLQERRVYPISTDAAIALYNAEHPEQYTSREDLTLEQAIDKFGQELPIPSRMLTRDKPIPGNLYGHDLTGITAHTPEELDHKIEQFHWDWLNDKIKLTEKSADPSVQHIIDRMNKDHADWQMVKDYCQQNNVTPHKLIEDHAYWSKLTQEKLSEAIKDKHY